MDPDFYFRGHKFACFTLTQLTLTEITNFSSKQSIYVVKYYKSRVLPTNTTFLSSCVVHTTISTVVAVGSSGILEVNQKLGVTFNRRH